MSECYIQVVQVDHPDALCRCDNCGHECRGDQLDMIHDIEQRLDPNGPTPAGECPECGALSYLVPPDPTRAERLISDLRVMADRLLSLDSKSIFIGEARHHADVLAIGRTSDFDLACAERVLDDITARHDALIKLGMKPL